MIADNRDYVTNIIDTYLRLSPSEIDDGMHWYDYARDKAIEWSGGDVWKGAGVIAAYSPLTPWWRNMELARETLLTNEPRTDAMALSIEKVCRILMGEDVLTVLNGPKLKAFASAIADPDTDLITIDSHAYSIAMGRHHFSQQARMGARTRREITAAYMEAAELAGIHVSAFQAMTWVGWRNRHVNKAARKGDNAR